MEDALYARVLNYLTIRPRSEKEIRDYISKQLHKPKVRKLFHRHSERSEESQATREDPSTSLRFAQDDNAIADRLITRLKTAKFLNDLEFAIWFIRSRTLYKPKGKRLISLELQQKGIGKDLIEEAFAAFDSAQEEYSELPRDEVTLAKELIEKKRRKYEGLDSRERFNKVGMMLAGRGFDLDTIKRAIDSVFGK